MAVDLRDVEAGAFDEVLGPQQARLGLVTGRGRRHGQRLVDQRRRTDAEAVGRGVEQRRRVGAVGRVRRVLPPRPRLQTFQ